MLWSSRNLMEVVIQAEDDEVGRCKDFLIDEMDWFVRYMVADTHKWLPGRKVLISPIALGNPDWELKHIPVKMTRADIEASPPLDADAQVEVQTLDGPVTLKIPSGTQSGRKLRLKDKGMPNPKGAPGDLYVVAQNELPRRKAAGYLQKQCNAASGGELDPCPPSAD